MTSRKQRQEFEAGRPPHESNATAPGNLLLIESTLAGQTDAFGELWCRHERAAYSEAYRILGNDADAQDALQESFIKAYSKLHTLENLSAFTTWLLKIVSTTAHGIKRENNQERANEAKYAAEHPTEKTCTSLDTPLADKQRELAVHILQYHATDEMRQICELRINQLSYNEIAQQLNITIWRVYITLKELRDIFEEHLARLEPSID